MTAYCCFPSMKALLLEALFDIAIPEAEDLFPAQSLEDPVSRLEWVSTAVDDIILANEAALRTMLVHSRQRGVRSDQDGDLPARQDRRTRLIRAALKPAHNQFMPEGPDTSAKGKALAFIVRREAMVVSGDIR
jgi:hypothetical protein